MRIKSILTASLLALAFIVTPALAQTPPPAPTADIIAPLFIGLQQMKALGMARMEGDPARPETLTLVPTVGRQHPEQKWYAIIDRKVTTRAGAPVDIDALLSAATNGSTDVGFVGFSNGCATLYVVEDITPGGPAKSFIEAGDWLDDYVSAEGKYTAMDLGNGQTEVKWTSGGRQFRARVLKANEPISNLPGNRSSLRLRVVVQ